MHIEVGLSYQKIASNINRKFEVEEIDWILNKQIDRLIENNIKVDESADGFQETVIEMDALRSLMVIDYPLDLYKKGSTDLVYCAELPGNYLHWIDHSTITACKPEAPQVHTATDENIYILSVPVTTKSTSPYYTSPALNISATVIPVKFPTNLPAKEMNFVILECLQNYLLNTELSYKVYWEQYRDIYSANSFIIVTETALANVSLVYDGQTIAAATQIKSKLKSATGTGKPVPARLVNSSKLSKLQGSAFHKSSKASPLATVQANTIKAYHDDSFIINGYKINYIRKPRKVSLNLNQSCDLPSSTHMKVCDMAVEYMKQAVGDPNYQWKLQDNQLRG